MQSDDLYIREGRPDGEVVFCNVLSLEDGEYKPCGHMSRRLQGWKVHYKRKHSNL